MDTASISLRHMPSRIFTVHLLVILLFLIAHSVVIFMVSGLDSETLTKAGRVLDMEEENSIPNFFSAFMLMITAGVAALIAIHHRKDRFKLWLSWCLAALTIAFLSFDEGAALHDRLAVAVQEAAQTSGMFYIGWTLPYLLVVIAAMPAAWPLLRSLPPRTMLRLIMAGALYVLSALGLEMIEGAVLERSVPPGMNLREALDYGVPWEWAVLVTFEEAGEMIAVALALRALLLHLTEDLGYSSLTVSKAAVTQPSLYGSRAAAPVTRN